MKNNLENAFKESLKDYEVPYDPKAWEGVNAQLDARSTSTGTGSSNILKWTVASVFTAALVVGGFYLNQNKNTQTALNQTASEINDNPTIGNNDVQTSENHTDKGVNAQNEGENGLTETNGNEIEPLGSTPENQFNNQVVTHSESSHDDQEVVFQDQDAITPNANNENQNTNDGVTPFHGAPQSAKFIAGRISALNICEGENVVISNPSKSELVKFQKEDGQLMVLDPDKSYVFKPKTSTKIYFVNNDNKRIATKEINVYRLPSVNFTYEANVYEKGLPVVICEAYGEYASYVWTFDEKIEKKGAKTLHNFFKKGDHKIALKVIDKNGCNNTMKKEVNIRNNYNLMAVDAFRPNGSDPRNRTFMPYSLTQRDVKFQLTIIDPTDNGVVFTTKDAKDSWDGTDQRTGEMTTRNKTFVWKVQIFNPVQNERPIYSGTIVHD